MPEPLTPAQYVARGFVPTRIGDRVVYVAPDAYYEACRRGRAERKRAAHKERPAANSAYAVPTKRPE